MRGKIILIEGTDCSGKETQSKLLYKKLKSDKIKCITMSYPDYNSPTGKIIGGPYLGKEYICDGWFPEGASQVDPKVSSLYFGADFLYHLDYMNKILDSGTSIILDRYFYSSFAHQGGKAKTQEERIKIYKWLEKLEFELLNLPDPDIKILLHMPYNSSCKLKSFRVEKPDQNESSKEHLLNAEMSYMEIASLYDFKIIECATLDNPRKIEEINEELYNYVIEKLR